MQFVNSTRIPLKKYFLGKLNLTVENLGSG